MMMNQYTTDLYNHLDVGVHSCAFVLLRTVVGIKRGEMAPNVGQAYVRAFRGERLSDAHRQQITFDEITPDPAQCPDITSPPYIFPEADLGPTVGHSELGHGATDCTVATVVGLHGGLVKEVHLLDVVDMPSFISINGHVVPLRFQDANAVGRTNNPTTSRPRSTLPELFRSQSVGNAATAATAATPTPADGASRIRPAPASPASSDSVQYLGAKKARRTQITDSDE
ncbi:hypothetical protein NCC49_000678 [Naganishia albida]|nr:hypothetical protein NCC49_000678 [Naganishia albida]